ncbi:MAG: hypothetical protein RL685_1201 [Pseudomonadota bacterium]|jgi:serine/threonine-protein kinase
MGVVVLAEHIELRERVAIKFLLDDAADNPELSERFLREARAAVKIRSEHVVRVSDVGRLPSGAPYLVMEYLEGEDLAQRLERGPVPLVDAVDYVMQCCEAMHVAHRSGIVHRDLKPANLFLTQRPDGSPLIKVLDFGISKVSGGEAAQLRLTSTQTMMGSPLYMSPEQMRSSKDVAASTDIWALGVILHELIAGDVPFTGSSVPEVLVKVMTEAPPPLRSLRPEVPEGLEGVVLRCLAKAPGERFSSMAALAVALTPYASAYTLGLQRRLHASRSEPAPAPTAAAPSPAGAAAAPAGLAATRVHEATPAALAPTPPAHIQAAAVATPAQTSTDWAGETGARPRGAPPWRRLPFIAAAAGLALIGLLLLARYRESFSTRNATPDDTATAAAPAPAAPAAATPPTAPVPAPEPAPSVTPAATPAPSTSATPPAAASRPSRRRPEAVKPARAARPAAGKPAAGRPAAAKPAPPPPAAPTPATRPRPLSIEFK